MSPEPGFPEPDPKHPPRLALRLLARLMPEDDRAAVVGDFEELWRRREEKPSFLDRLEFWAQAVGVGFGFARYRLSSLARLSGRHPPPRTPVFSPKGPSRPSPVTTWIQDLRTAVRTLRRQPLFTSAVVLTLALGIGATTAVFSTADALLFRPLPFQEPDRLVFVPLVVPAYEGRPESEVEWSYPKVRLLLESTDAFQASTTYQTGTQTLTGESDPEEIRIESVGSGYFDLLGVEMVEGRVFQAEEDRTGKRPFVAILSHDLWIRRYGGSPEVLGRTIRLNDNSFVVVGIAQAGFPGLSGTAELWIPAMTQDARVLNNPNNHAHELFARLREGVSLDQARAQLRGFARALAEAYPPDNPNLPSLGIRATPLRELRSDPPTRTAVLLLLGAIVTVLFIACLNLGNLLLVRARKRGPEIAIRAALGAGRSRIVGQGMSSCDQPAERTLSRFSLPFEDCWGSWTPICPSPTSRRCQRESRMRPPQRASRP